MKQESHPGQKRRLTVHLKSLTYPGGQLLAQGLLPFQWYQCYLNNELGRGSAEISQGRLLIQCEDALASQPVVRLAPRVAALLRQCVAEEGVAEQPSLRLCTADTVCSLCLGELSGQAIEARYYSLGFSQAELGELFYRRHSLRRLGASSSWGSFFQLLRQHQYCVSVERDQAGKLRLLFPADQHPAGEGSD